MASTGTITATVKKNGAALAGRTVAISSADPSKATVAPASAVSDANGQVTATVTAVAVTAAVNIHFTVDGVSADCAVDVAAAPTNGYDVSWTSAADLNGFTSTGAAWSLYDNGGIPSIKPPANATYLLRTGQSVADATLTARVKTPPASGVLLVLRYTDANNQLYVILANDHGELVEIKAGAVASLGTRNWGLTLDGTAEHAFTISAAGSSVAVKMDGVQVGAAATTTVLSPGKTGIRANPITPVGRLTCTEP